MNKNTNKKNCNKKNCKKKNVKIWSSDKFNDIGNKEKQKIKTTDENDENLINIKNSIEESKQKISVYWFSMTYVIEGQNFVFYINISKIDEKFWGSVILRNVGK